MDDVVNLLADKDLSTVYSSEYWNSIEDEKKKHWWIDDNGELLIDFLNKSGLLDEYKSAESYIKQSKSSCLISVADLAAGTGWTSAFISRLPEVGVIHAIEISRHRLGELFEKTVKVLQGDPNKIKRYLGSFYDTKLGDATIDVVILSQAFHHSDEPHLLLAEVSRILKNGGKALLIGEHFIGWKTFLKRCVSVLVRERRFTISFFDLFPPDSASEGGDHYYRVSDYFLMAKKFGFNISMQKLKSKNVMYILTKK